MLKDRLIIALGERDGISGPAIAACVDGGRWIGPRSSRRNASSEPPQAPWMCRARRRLSAWRSSTARTSCWFLLGAPDAESAEIAAENGRARRSLVRRSIGREPSWGSSYITCWTLRSGSRYRRRSGRKQIGVHGRRAETPGR